MKSIVRVALTAVLVGAVGFFGGVRYSQSSGASDVAGTNGRSAAGGGMGATSGDVIAAESGSITVKQADGSTRVVYFSPTTRITHSAEATLTDLTKGITVIASGASGDTSDTLTARSVQIVPKGTDPAAFGGGRGGGPSN